jgi:predicted MFS family arabinose efflux permease
MKDPIAQKLTRRLLPLYVASFFHGFVLWYAVEKLFMHHIGFDDAGIGVMVAAYSALMLLCETPSGILADRWSRKGVLMIASVFLAISGLVNGISTEPMLYIIGSLVWGMFYALYSGTYDSVIYDTVKEETGKGDLYDRYFGRYRAVDSVALVLGSLLSGVIGQWWGLPATFYISVPFALAAIFALWRFKEPQIHKEGQDANLVAHVRETFRLVLGRRVLVPLVTLIVTIYLIMELIYEFSQLWFIAVAAPPVLMGPAFAIVLAASGLSGYLLGIIPSRSRKVALGAYAALFASALVLMFVPNLAVLVVAQFVLAFTAVGLSIVTMRELHDALPSRVRAGASSAISTVSRVFLIPASLLFGVLSTQATVFTAAWILAGLGAFALVLELARPKNR